MNDSSHLHLHRRQALVLAGAGALLPAARAQAQPTAPSRPDWLAVVRRHHDLVERAFQVLLAPNDSQWERLGLQLRSLDQLLAAHSLAEETAIYPRMALAGLQEAAEHLYADEAHFKIEKMRLEVALRARQEEKGWRDSAIALRDAVLRHARQDEEQRLFPQLHGKLDGAANRQLTQAYNREFGRVLPAPVR